MTRFFGEIRRFDEEQRMVWGYASTEQRAVDGKIIRRCAMERALDDYMEFANIREMHQPSAVGVAREAHVDEGGLYIGAHVVDDQAWEKVKTGVYRAFSIRAKPTAYDPLDPTAITDMLIREISLVDRPGDAGTKFDCFRAADFNEGEDLENPINTAAPGAEEDDMSRAAAKKPAADAAPAPEAPAAAAQPEVARAADPDAAPAGDEPQADAPEAAAEAPAAAEETASEAQAAPEAVAEPDADPVARAIDAADAALQMVDQAVEAAERAAAGESAVPVCLAAGMEVRRGISTVGRLGYLLSEFAYIIFEADFDKEIEGDASTVPAKLRTALAAMGVAYKAMAEEELAELLKSAGVEGSVERAAIALIVTDDELQRSADLEISPEFAGRLQTLFDGFVTRGWSPVLPASEDDDLVRQVASLTADRTKLLGAFDTLTGRMTELSETVSRLADATPVPAKTGGSLARSVGKEEDAGGPAAAEPKAPLSTDEVQRLLADMPEEERALMLTRAALSRPRAITTTTRQAAPAA